MGREINGQHRPHRHDLQMWHYRATKQHPRVRVSASSEKREERRNDREEKKREDPRDESTTKGEEAGQDKTAEGREVKEDRKEYENRRADKASLPYRGWSEIGIGGGRDTG